MSKYIHLLSLIVSAKIYFKNQIIKFFMKQISILILFILSRRFARKRAYEFTPPLTLNYL